MNSVLLDKILRKLEEPAPYDPKAVWGSNDLATALGEDHKVIFLELLRLKKSGHIIGYEGHGEWNGETVQTIAVKLSNDGRIFIQDSSFVEEEAKKTQQLTRDSNAAAKTRQDINLNRFNIYWRWAAAALALLMVLFAAFKSCN